MWSDSRFLYFIVFQSGGYLLFSKFLFAVQVAFVCRSARLHRSDRVAQTGSRRPDDQILSFCQFGLMAFSLPLRNHLSRTFSLT